MRGTQRRQSEVELIGSAVTPPDDPLGREVEAFLSGRWTEVRGRVGASVPAWAWLNQAAHADTETLRSVANRPARPTPATGEDVQVLVARALLAAAAPHGVERLQREVLVPLELRLIGDVASPRHVVELATTALFG